MRLNLIAPVYANHPHGSECRLVRWLNTEEGKALDIKLTITDLRTSHVNITNIQNDYDATLVFKGETLTPDQIQLCSRPRILYFPDDVIKYPNYARFINHVGKHYDLVYTFDREAVNCFYHLGCKNVKWLPSWTGSDMFFDKGMERDIDISFIGSFNDERIKMLQHVKYNFLDKKLFFDDNTYGETYVDILNRSKIVLNFAQGNSGVSQRVFEATACGALVLTNYVKELEDLFIVYIGDMELNEISCFKNSDSLVKQIKYLLGDENYMQIVAKNGQRRTMKEHLVQHRFKQILEDINFLKTQKELSKHFSQIDNIKLSEEEKTQLDAVRFFERNSNSEEIE